MTDRELLELAAKAAGISLLWGGPDKDMARRTDTFDNWNPLTDDGDALRLACALRMTIDYNERGVFAGSNRPEPHGGYADEDGHDAAATRRAIVRAAAEMGREK